LESISIACNKSVILKCEHVLSLSTGTVIEETIIPASEFSTQYSFKTPLAECINEQNAL